MNPSGLTFENKNLSKAAVAMKKRVIEAAKDPPKPKSHSKSATADSKDSDADSNEETVSSDTAEKQAKWKKVKTEQADSSAKSIAKAVPTPQTSAIFGAFKPEAIPDIRSFEDLVKDFPYIMNGGNGDNASDVTERKRIQEDESRFGQSVEDEKMNPVMYQMVQECINRLPRPEFRIATDDQTSAKVIDYEKELMERRRTLPVFTAEHMAEMSQQAGKFRHKNGNYYDFPACSQGDNCCVRKLEIKNMPVGGFTGMAYFLPEEYEDFLSSRVAPMVSRTCVTCICFDTTSLAITVSAYPDLLPVDKNCVFQVFRNLCDQEGGYFRQFLVGPKPNKYVGIVDMIRVVRLSSMKVVEDPVSHRLRLDDSAMVWKPPARLLPRIGDSREDFLYRSREYYRSIEKSELHIDIRPALLRSIQSKGDTEILYDHFLRRYNQDPSYTNAIALDSFLVRPGAIADFQELICENTIADMYSKVADCCFFIQLKGFTKKDPYIHIVSKSLPQKCQRRKFPQVCARYMKKTPRFKNDVLDWFVCSLLGNYRHVEGKYRPPLDARQRLYRIKRDNPNRLLSYCYEDRPGQKEVYCRHENLFKCAVGEYLVFLVNDNPALKSHIQAMFQWDRFASKIIDSMNQIRVLFWKNSPEPGIEPSSHDRLELACNFSQERILEDSYKRRQPSLMQVFHNLRSFLVNSHGYTIAEPDAERRQVINHVISQADQISTNPTHAVLDLLPALGVPYEAFKEIYSLYEMHDTFRLRNEPIRRQLLKVAADFPRSLSLLDYFARRWKSSTWIHMHRLPIHYAWYQLQAISERFDLKADSIHFANESFEFWFCPVCQVSYSILVTTCKPCRKHNTIWCSVCHKQYEFGNQKMVVDYINNKMYCSAKKRDKDRKRHQLVKVSLLGNLLVMNNQQITLCPQKGCGRRMVLNPEICEYNERGFACTLCSHGMRQRRLADVRGVEDVSINMEEVTECARCMHKITKQMPAFLYPHNIVLCRKHHGERIASAVAELPLSTSREGVMKEINRQIVMREEFNRLKYSKQQQAMLNRSKREFRRK